MNLEAHAIFIGVTSFHLNIRDLKISIQKEKQCHSTAIGYWCNITRINWKKLKKAILENNVNVQKQLQEVFYKKN